MGSGERQGALADGLYELLTTLQEGRGGQVHCIVQVGLTTWPLALLALPVIHEFRLHGKGRAL